ncbi:hypothetical protein [Paenibacillus qinlingensis]|uniref:Uncharacterized protein n=1 Tax=Paenibacillus qinlingensis TaxID=1837343 RepID=A0ABU1NWI5_9BACL|nr:hypothetical protein [Paenibacillus qinlingensis]MDR6551844.1 hypothetical protein [Paenibacillus qinlingensis]
MNKVTHQANSGAKQLKRATLEMSLKPFKSLEQAAIDDVCTEALRQWQPLIGMAESASLLLWVSDGSEILTWNGQVEDEFEWGRYIGFANEEMFSHVKDKNDPHVARLYIDNPVRFTYGDLRKVVDSFKRIALDQFNVQLEVGVPFDAGPEFAYSDFKYKDHPEINRAELGGSFVSLKADYTVVCSWSKLKADTNAYAAYPDGIPEGTPFGEFLGRQCASFLPALGFDYIWFSNGFALSYFPWTYLGANYNGTDLPLADYKELSSKIMSFWDLFKQECPGVRTEVRGTNYGTGMDLAKDYIPLLELYEKKYLDFPPPNSPWGALNYDFGLELTGYMSRIAELPGETYPYRFYVNDPWFWQNPWWDYYDHEPHDIYGPLSVARMNAAGALEMPGIVEILTIDTEKGELWADGPAEVIPYIQKAFREAPDEPGLLTWLYPFRELHEAVQGDNEASSRVFFHDWFVRCAINHGFPLNTVLGTDTFRTMSSEARRKLESTILFVNAMWLDDASITELADMIRDGGKVLVYGDVRQAALLELLNLQPTDGVGLEGDFDLALSFDEDEIYGDKGERKLRHRADIGDGSLGVVLRNKADAGTRVGAVAIQDGEERIFALSRTLVEWNGGRIGWVRGSLPFAKTGVTHLPVRQENEWMDTSILLRYMLQDFGIMMKQVKQDADSQSVLTFVSRHRNSFIMTGCKQDSSVQLKLRFPDGVPLFPGQTIVLGEGEAELYSLDRTFRDECRVFVNQQERSRVSCREISPTPSKVKRMVRTLSISNLLNADVTIYPPLEMLALGAIEIKQGNGSIVDWHGMQIGNRLRLDGITGTINISW